MLSKRAWTLTVVLIVLAVALPVLSYQFSDIQDVKMKRFSSYDQLKAFLKESTQSSVSHLVDSPRFPGPSTDSFSSEGTEYSQTNVQVEGVDESDIVKTDGRLIYVASGGNVSILVAYPASEARLLWRLDVNATVQGLYVNEHRLVVLAEVWKPAEDCSVGEFPELRPCPATGFQSSYSTVLKVYHVDEQSPPSFLGQVSSEGIYFSSRMIGPYVYLVVNRWAYFQNEEVPLPAIETSDGITEVRATEIYYTPVPDYSYTFTTIMAVDILAAEIESSSQTVLVGSTRTMYVSTSNIYITTPKSSVYILNFAAPAVSIGTITPTTPTRPAPAEPETRDSTIVHRISIEEDRIAYEAAGVVPGGVLNQFSMDEYQGYFRIATTTWGQSTNVYVLDMDLRIVGSVEDLAPGETMHSARFMGNRGYLVTFKKIDPFFVVDLEDPSDPRVLGELKVTGYSDYLHPYDENHIIGIGKETVEGEGGTFAWYQGVKISLFDVSDLNNPKEVAKYEIGDRGSDTPVLTDHRAFLFDRSRNLLVLPVAVAQIDPAKYGGEVPPWAWGDLVWQGAYVFHISLQGLTLRGKITHVDNWNISEPFRFWEPPTGFIQRSLFIGEVLYTISDKAVKLNNLVDLHEIGLISLIG